VETEKAVKAFQQENGLKPTGEIGPKTAIKLEDEVRIELKKEKNDLQLKTALKLVSK
jgi:carboxyl-terminal processing protease